MSRRVRHLVAYDIRDEKRLRHVAKLIKGYGDRLQYSVYVCDLSNQELIAMKEALRRVVHHAMDSVVIIPLGEGYDVSCFEFLGPIPPMPQNGSVIV